MQDDFQNVEYLRDCQVLDAARNYFHNHWAYCCYSSLAMQSEIEGDDRRAKRNTLAKPSN